MSLKNDVEEVQIAIDKYEELFSDFDISPYKNRSISLDLKEELESKNLDFSKKIQIIFSIPQIERDLNQEKIIVKRLNSFFNTKNLQYERRIFSRRKRGIKYIIMGIFFITLTFIFEMFFTDLFPLYVANIIMILGWFGIWTGVEKILDVPQELFSKSQMYNGFSKANINFVDEEKIIKN